MYRQLLLLSAVMIFSPVIANAQEPLTKGWYLGIALGVTQLDASESELLEEFNSSSPVNANSVDIDKSGSLVGAVIGRQLWTFLSVEGGYTEFGEYEAEFDFGSNMTGTAEANAKATFLGLQAFTPREKRWGLYGKAGIARWELSGGIDDDGADPYVGLGVSRKYLESGRINVGVERFKIDDDAIDSVSIGFVAQF